MSDRYPQYTNTEYRGLLTRLSKADTNAIDDLVAWLKDHDDVRWRRIEDGGSMYGRANPQSCLRTLEAVGVHTCTLCWGCNWPNMKINPRCRWCGGTGFTHHVDLPPGCGFTVGWSPGLWNLNGNAVLNAAKSAAKSFMEIFK